MGKVISVAMVYKDAFTNPCKKSMRAMEELATSYKKTGRQISNAGKTITNAGSKLTKTVTLPIAGIAAASVKTAADFEASMSRVKSITNATDDEFKKMEKQAQDLGKKTAWSASEVAQAMQETGMAGWGAEKNLKGLEGILNLASATGIDLSRSAEIMTNSLNAYGKSAGESAHFADVLTKACTSASVNANGLGESFKYCASLSGSMKYTVEDTVTALAAMGDKFTKDSSAGTTLKTALANMAAPTEKMKSAMKELGISLTNNDGSMKSLDGVIRNIRTSFKGLGESEQAAYAKTIFGKNAMAGMLAIIGTSEKKYNKLSKAINNSSGAAKKAAGTNLNNLKGQLILLKSALEGAAIMIGNKLTPHIKKVTGFIQSLADKFNNLSDKQVNTIIKFAGIAAAVGPAVMVIGKIIGTVGSAVTIFSKVTKTISAFGGIMGLITSPAGIVIAVVAALAAVALIVIKNWDKIKPALQKVANFLKQVFGPAFKSVGNFIKKNMIPIINQVKKICNQLKPVFSAVSNVTKKAFSAAAGFVKKHMGAIQKVVKAVMNRIIFPFKVAFAVITSVIQSWLTSISGVISGVKKIFSGIIDFVKGVFTGNWKKAWEGVKKIFSGIFETFLNIVKVPFNAIINLINKAIGAINGALGKIKIPKWVPVFGGKSFNFQIPKIPNLAHGTLDWKGGPVQVHERGGEIIDLPKGSRVYPHDESLKMAKEKGNTNIKIEIKKLADKIVATDDEDIDEMVDKFATKLKLVFDNM